MLHYDDKLNIGVKLGIVASFTVLCHSVKTLKFYKVTLIRREILISDFWNWSRYAQVGTAYVISKTDSRLEKKIET